MPRTLAVQLAVLVTLIVAACGTEQPKRQPDSARPWGGWTLADTGLGPIVVGMTPSEANSAAGGSLQLPESPPTEGCAFASAPGIEGLSLMIENGRIVRIEVRAPGLKTAEGATVGDSEDRIQELYAGRVTTSPHKYTAGHYLIVTPRRGSRGTTGLIFETDGRLVTEFRGGLLPQVAYVERCG